MWPLASLVLAFSALLVTAEMPMDGDVIVLNDANFEHLTQATTGATTGDWLVEFYAPWCGHCKKLAPVWAELATELKGQIPVAKLDATANPKTAKRFDVRGYPTIVFLKNGKYYPFKGARDVNTLAEFALEEWKETAGIPVPREQTEFERLQQVFVEDVQTLYKFKKLALGVTLGVGFFLGFVTHAALARLFSRGGGKRRTNNKKNNNNNNNKTSKNNSAKTKTK